LGPGYTGSYLNQVEQVTGSKGGREQWRGLHSSVLSERTTREMLPVRQGLHSEHLTQL
jgi:hypothetical protein